MRTIRYSELLHRSNRVAIRLNITSEHAMINLVENIVRDEPLCVEVEHSFKSETIQAPVLFAADRVVELDSDGVVSKVITDRQREAEIAKTRPWVTIDLDELRRHAINIAQDRKGSFSVSKEMRLIVEHARKFFFVSLEVRGEAYAPTSVLYAVDRYVVDGVVKKDRIDGTR